MRKYGISVLSLLPISFGFRGLSRAASYCLEHNLHLQLVPCAWWLRSDVERLPSELVMSYEPAWNQGRGILRTVTKICRCDIKAAVMDSMLFGVRIRPQQARLHHFVQKFPQAWPIDCGPGGLIEHFYGPSVPQLMQRYQGLVIDTWHIREERFAIPDPIGLMEKALYENHVKLIHFQTRNFIELEAFARGDDGFLRRSLRALRKADPSVGVVIELDPRYLKKIPLHVIRSRIEDNLE